MPIKKVIIVGANIALPNTIDKNRCEIECGLFVGLPESKLFKRNLDVATCISEERPQAKFLFKKTSLNYCSFKCAYFQRLLRPVIFSFEAVEDVSMDNETKQTDISLFDAHSSSMFNKTDGLELMKQFICHTPFKEHGESYGESHVRSENCRQKDD